MVRSKSQSATAACCDHTWIPTTWIYRDGQLRAALNYGEVRFPLLQQLVDDAREKWDR